MGQWQRGPRRHAWATPGPGRAVSPSMARAGFPVGVGAARPSPGEGFCWQSGFGGLCLDPRRSEGTPSSQGRGHQCLRGYPQPPSLSPGFSALRTAEKLPHQRSGHTGCGGRGGARPGHRASGPAHGLSAGTQILLGISPLPCRVSTCAQCPCSRARVCACACARTRLCSALSGVSVRARMHECWARGGRPCMPVLTNSVLLLPAPPDRGNPDGSMTP